MAVTIFKHTSLEQGQVATYPGTYPSRFDLLAPPRLLDVGLWFELCTAPGSSTGIILDRGQTRGMV